MGNNKILGLRTVIYKVGEISIAKEWYAKAFEVEPYFDEPFYVGFDIGGYELGLQPEEQSRKDRVESVIAYWGVDDIATEFNRLVTLGATAYERPKDVGEGIIVAQLKDPWENIIGLIHNPHFKVTF
ncbi:VOC family protein [Olivibacter sp. SDN3]|uniref:VOC family protein n=1 Tax=Olivibacter sp. SDN3 TaxID=2764720 RepID=UPI0016518F96|nr:VOC family protein [Olivibacter sp. SDN3]QNL48719.1 VOC family protein [Olivibacter sp. SDN3]